MATEASYQSKIMKWIKANGGTAITGILKTGEADIQAGWPVELVLPKGERKTVLLNIAIEVKTEPDYYRVMRGVKEEAGFYKIVDTTPLKKHEVLQITKLNRVRMLGGMALIAFSVEQVNNYIRRNIYV